MDSAAPLQASPRYPIALVAFELAGLNALQQTAETLAEFGLSSQPIGVGATEIAEFASATVRNGAAVVIVAARGAGAVRRLAAALTVPVIRVPVAAGSSPAAALAALTDGAGGQGEGAFATVALGEAGYRNAALLAVSILALTDAGLREAWDAFREKQTRAVLAQPPPSG